MPISMQMSARYTTQSGVWSIQFGKPLTNRRITFYQRQGYYDGAFVRLNARLADKARRQSRISTKDLFAGF